MTTDPDSEGLYFVGSQPDAVWIPLLKSAIEQADRFELRMPAEEGPLSRGIREFSALPGVTTLAWDGMADAIVLRGPLDERTEELLRSFEASLRTLDPDRKLWDYRLLDGDRPVLAVSDFTVLRVAPALLDGVDTGGWGAPPAARS